MSLPPEPQHTIHIELTATQAEDLAKRITRALLLQKTLQDKSPEQCSFYTWNPLFSIATGIELEILPDKKHQGCSDYCHY